MPMEKAGILELTVAELQDLKAHQSPGVQATVPANESETNWKDRYCAGPTGPTGPVGPGATGLVGPTGPMGMSGLQGLKGDAFQIDEFGPLTAISVAATECSESAVSVFLVTHDLRTGQDIIPPLGASQDFSRHLLFCDSGEWFDYGLFVALPGPQGPVGAVGATGPAGPCQNTEFDIQCLQKEIQNLKHRVALLEGAHVGR